MDKQAELHSSRHWPPNLRWEVDHYVFRMAIDRRGIANQCKGINILTPMLDADTRDYLRLQYPDTPADFAWLRNQISDHIQIMITWPGYANYPSQRIRVYNEDGTSITMQKLAEEVCAFVCKFFIEHHELPPHPSEKRWAIGNSPGKYQMRHVCIPFINRLYDDWFQVVMNVPEPDELDEGREMDSRSYILHDVKKYIENGFPGNGI